MPVDAFIWFCKIEGIPGPSTDAAHPKAFEIKDFSFGVENPTTIGSATGGAGGGKAHFSEFNITKTADSASPVIFKACASGQHLKSAVITCRKAGERQEDFLKVTFTDVLVSSYQNAGQASTPSQPPTDVSFTSADVIAPPSQTPGPDDDLLDSISFNYAKVEMIEGRPRRTGVEPTKAGTLTFNSRTNEVTVGDWNGITTVGVNGGNLMRAVQEFDVKILIGLLTAPFSIARLGLVVQEVREPAITPGGSDVVLLLDETPGPDDDKKKGPSPHMRFDVLLYGDADGVVDASDLTRPGKRIGQLQLDPDGDPAMLDIDLGPILLKHDTDTFGIRLQLHGAGIPDEPVGDEGPEEDQGAGRPDVSASFAMELVLDTVA